MTIKLKRHYDELCIDFKDYSQLSYEDNGQSAFVKIYIDNEPNAYTKVFTDVENENREYVCINYAILYLDTIKQTK
jgi:hypothetical protein